MFFYNVSEAIDSILHPDPEAPPGQSFEYSIEGWHLEGIGIEDWTLYIDLTLDVRFAMPMLAPVWISLFSTDVYYLGVGGTWDDHDHLARIKWPTEDTTPVFSYPIDSSMSRFDNIMVLLLILIFYIFPVKKQSFSRKSLIGHNNIINNQHKKRKFRLLCIWQYYKKYSNV